MESVIAPLSIAAVPVLGGLIWWLFRGRLARDQRHHEEMAAAIAKIRESLVNHAGATVSVDDCRVCRESTTNAMQAVQIRLSTMQESIADVREKVASGLGTLSGKLDTLTRMVAAKTTVSGDKQ